VKPVQTLKAQAWNGGLTVPMRRKVCTIPLVPRIRQMHGNVQGKIKIHSLVFWVCQFKKASIAHVANFVHLYAAQFLEHVRDSNLQQTKNKRMRMGRGFRIIILVTQIGTFIMLTFSEA
jgi:hypothetical protein